MTKIERGSHDIVPMPKQARDHRIVSRINFEVKDEEHDTLDDPGIWTDKARHSRGVGFWRTSMVSPPGLEPGTL